VSSAPERRATLGTPRLERALRRDGTIVLLGLALLWALTAVWVVAGAGLGMNAWDMTRMALLPQHHAAPLGDMATMDMRYMMSAWGVAHFALMAGMWWTMMVAMMAPSAAPTMLLFARVHRHRQATGQLAAAPPTAAFVAGYFLVWLAFSLAATALQWWLEDARVLSKMTMGLRAQWLAGGVLVAAGIYQFTPWKNACLATCRAPAAFLAQHWRPGARGALRMGVLHGAYCLGCCWALMALLFVGGVMNLVWIAVLTLLVLAEKLLPGGRRVGFVAGTLLITWGLWILVGA
jgi:predicted metal-binding membrane protein